MTGLKKVQSSAGQMALLAHFKSCAKCQRLRSYVLTGPDARLLCSSAEKLYVAWKDEDPSE